MKSRIEILMLVATAVVLLLLIYYDGYKEGFVNSNSPRPAVTKCPDLGFIKATAYYDKKDVMCCEGIVKNNKCDSRTVCTLGKATKDIKSCTDIMAEGAEYASKFACPSKMPNAYYNPETGEAGCTDSPIKPNYKGPVRSTANKCNAYLKVKDNGSGGKQVDMEYLNLGYTNPDGCLGQVKLEQLEKECIGQDCVPFSRKVPSKNIALYGLDFTDVDNVRRTCYDYSTYGEYIGKINPNAKLYESPYKEQLCHNAKALYIDKGK